MCGIAGRFERDGARPELLRAMSRALTHRGPDDEGYLEDGCIGLAHRRLSIIDLTGGHQPLGNEDGSIQIVFNGEIYNYRELRRELIDKGHRFATATDTEVIVHLYEEMGERCVEKLRGMFAFAIWDRRSRRLVLARDRLGQKPLFYTRTPAGFLFASEVKGLLVDPEVARRPNPAAIHHYLSYRFVPASETVFEGIRELPPAHVAVLADPAREPRLERYWDVRYEPKYEAGEEQVLDELDALMEETIGIHLVSDVPVGAYLSGGLDSSLVVAYGSKLLDAPLATFGIGVSESSFNELPYARDVAEHYHTDHHERMVEADVIGQLPTMIRHLDQPSDPIAACMSEAARFAAAHRKVVLTGDGGDEIFAGYDRFFGYRWVSLYAALPAALRRTVFTRLIEMVSEDFSYKSWTQKLRWVHELSFSNGGARYAAATSFFRFPPSMADGLYTPQMRQALSGVDEVETISRYFDAPSVDALVDRMLYADVRTRLPQHSLVLTDRLTMAHSLEARSPLLDHKLVEYVAKLPARYKLRGRTLKYVQRRLAERYLPQGIIRRPKQGFMFPLAFWMTDELAAPIDRMFNESLLVRDGYLRGEMLRRLTEEHRARRVDHHVRIWLLLNLEIWYRMYMHGVPMEELRADLRRSSRIEGRLIDSVPTVA